jgi:hypothetical protein
MTVAGLAVARGTRIGEFAVCTGCGGAVFQARRDDGLVAALKFAPAAQAECLERESAVLEQLTGCATPAVLGHGSCDGNACLALGWRHGIEVRRAALEAREAGDRGALLGICVGLLRAYAEIHDRGVVHGNVHPRHALVDRDGSVSVLDFAPARPLVGMLSPPAQAEAWLVGGEAVRPDPRDEQYSLAALVYLLLCGRMYFTAARDRGTLARQILMEPPLPFATHDEAAWPVVESPLARALSKEPSERFESARELADALAQGARGVGRPVRPRSAAAPPALDDHLEQFRALTAVDGPLIGGGIRPPTCSVNYGAAGIAFALYRLARAGRESGALDAAAAWIDLAERERGSAGAFYRHSLDLTPESIGLVSPYHTASGVALVRALLCRHRRDAAGEQEAIDAYLARTAAPCSNLDLTLGLCSVLLGGALLLDGADPAWEVSQRLRDRGDALLARVWSDFSPSGMPRLGIAHGWAGVVYATLMWSRAREMAPPATALEVLDTLAWLAEPHGRGVRWPWRSEESNGPEGYWPGWCGGEAGHVFLWTLAAAVYGESDLLEVAERAAWSTWDRPVRVTSLCCGTAGQAYALLNIFRHTGERAWLERAGARAGHAARSGVLAGDSVSPANLYKGHAGLAVLAAELRSPELAAMPLFEPEPFTW